MLGDRQNPVFLIQDKRDRLLQWQWHTIQIRRDQDFPLMETTYISGFTTEKSAVEYGMAKGWL